VDARPDQLFNDTDVSNTRGAAAAQRNSNPDSHPIRGYSANRANKIAAI